jgi:ubiquinone/menaquinone biosynthesis C-methylase UbiE
MPVRFSSVLVRASRVARPPVSSARVRKNQAMEGTRRTAVYDRIGTGYMTNRRPDPHWEQRIHRALGHVRRVINVGAGTGSYEPRDRHVIAVEPSELMISQRTPDSHPVVRAVAESLPFPSQSFDAALAVLTVHHWHDIDAGLRELRRVARRQVVVTWDPRETGQLWLVEEYLPELLVYERQLDPIDSVQDALHVEAVEPLAVPADCTDGFMAAFWRRPAAYLDPTVRASISGLSLLDQALVKPAMARLAHDLETGIWHRRHQNLLELDELDLGYKLVVANS